MKNSVNCAATQQGGIFRSRSAKVLLAFLTIGFSSSAIVAIYEPGDRAVLSQKTLPVQVIELAKATSGEEVVARGDSAEKRNRMIPYSTRPLEQVRPFSAIPVHDPEYPIALQCLSQAIFYEAANESRAGKLGVAQVVLNRVRHPAYPHSVCGVVYEGWDQSVCQFSFTCDGSLMRSAAGPRWEESQAVAKAILAGETSKEVGSATNYHAQYVVPRWAYKLAKVDQIDTHIFYRLPNQWGSARALSSQWSRGERIPNIGRTWLAAKAQSTEDTQIAPPEELRGYVPVDVADRHAETDIGGRLNPAKEWRLTIPDPVVASSSYTAIAAKQGLDLPTRGGVAGR